MSSAQQAGLEAAKLLPQYSPRSHSVELHNQVCSVTNSGVPVAFSLPSMSTCFMFQHCPACLHHVVSPLLLCPAKMGQYVVTLLLSLSGLNLEHADLLNSPVQCLLVKITRHILKSRSNRYAQQALYEAIHASCLVTSRSRLVSCSVHQHLVNAM